jgi:outer membrane protein assembly factor BamB
MLPGDVQAAHLWEGTVYTRTDGFSGSGFSAVDARSGQRRWTHPSEVPVLFDPLVVAAGVVYAMGSDAQGLPAFAALDAATGEVRWSWSEQWGGPIGVWAANASAAIATWDTADHGELLGCRDPATGAVRWARPPGEFGFPTDDVPGSARPTVVLTPGRAHMLLDAQLVTVDTATGATVWTRTCDSNRSDLCASAETAGVLYLADTGTAYALDAMSGDEIWRAPIERTISDAPAVAVRGTLMAVACGPDLRLLDAGTGASRWTWSHAEELAEDRVRSAPAVDGDSVYVWAATRTDVSTGADDFSVVAVQSSTGRVLWRLPTPVPADNRHLGVHADAGLIIAATDKTVARIVVD